MNVKDDKVIEQVAGKTKEVRKIILIEMLEFKECMEKNYLKN